MCSDLNGFLGNRTLNYVNSSLKVDEYRLGIAAVEQARQEWDLAKRIFEQVSEPELVDYAIYMMQATECRYMYLLRKMKEKQDPSSLPIRVNDILTPLEMD